MSSLLGLLNLGGGALTAQHAGVATSGRNTANVNTEGYARESVDLSAELGAPLIGGVRARGLRRAEDQILALRERLSDAARGRAGNLATSLSNLEHGLTSAGEDMVHAIATLFGGLLDLASAPMDEALRAQVVSSARATGTAFQSASAAITAARADADHRATDLANEATRQAATIASLNQAMRTNQDPVLADQRDLAARKLAELTGAQARLDPDGMMRVTLGGGEVLVDGARAAHFETTPDATLGGHVRLDVVDGVHRRDVTALAGGKLGGEIAFRDGAAAQAAADLDQLAFDLASRLNTTHRAGAALDGSTGRDLFVQPAAPAGAAAAMALDPAVSADPRLLAVAATGAGPSDNRNGLALAALGNQLLAGGGTRSFTDEAIHSLGALGLAARQAKGDADVEQARGDALAALRDGLSGVSLEDEMVRLSQFQHAAEAATRFVSTVDNMLNDMIKNL